MKLSQLAAKPQLIEIVLDDADTVREHGEPVSFWTWDRQPLNMFMKLATAQTQDPAVIIDIVNTLMLDETGKPIVSNEQMLPTDIMIRAMSKLTDRLGKS